MDSRLPIQPKYDLYRGTDKKKLKRQRDFDDLAEKIALHANKELANNPSDLQTIYFSKIANEMNIKDVETVWRAISKDASKNGLTIRVTLDEREALAALKTRLHDGR
jgi:hypothetical protein